jgi:hypothetical protein
MREDCPAGEYVSNSHISQFADSILAAIRAGTVPGIWATRLDPEKVRNAHMEEIAALRARVAELETDGTVWSDRFNGMVKERDKLRAEVERLTGRSNQST